MSVVQATFAATLVDEWVRDGVTDAVVCPGSRSTPLAVALAAADGLTVHVGLDERSAGFFALGVAASTGRPVVVCVTSGTAAAELHPAVVEAHHGHVALLVCTADRPPELHGVGAPQSIAQSGLYGGALRWWAEPGVAAEEVAGTWRSLAARAVAESRDGPLGPGPVHLNLAFRDPLVAEPGPLPPGRPGGAPAHRVVRAGGAGQIDPWASGRGVLLAGAHAGPPGGVLALAEHLGWPVLADARSGCRVEHPLVVAAADAIARAAPAHLRPDVVVRLGARWTSKALPEFFSGAHVVAVDPWWSWEDPERTAAVVHCADPGAWADAARRAPAPPTPGGWARAWAGAEEAAQRAIESVLGRGPLSEPAIARRVFASVPADATLVVSSSMPVRDMEWFAPRTPAPPRVLANRGANGIDGVCSTARGVAAGSGGRPVVAVVGDLAFLHDLSGFVAPAGAPPGPVVIVVVDNGGGGIFEFLPQAAALDRALFDRLFGTPQRVDVVDAAAGLGARTADVTTASALLDALGAALGVPGTTVVRARVPARPGNVAVHEEVHGAVAEALGT